MQAAAVTSAFGNYMRYYAQCRSTGIHVLNSTPMRKNAFEVLMCAQAEKVSVVLPSKVQVLTRFVFFFYFLCKDTCITCPFVYVASIIFV